MAGKEMILMIFPTRISPDIGAFSLKGAYASTQEVPPGGSPGGTWSVF